MKEEQEIIYVEIKNIDNCQYEINGKLIYKDKLGNWQSEIELSQIEKVAFKSYVGLMLKDANDNEIGQDINKKCN
jgi:S-adenosylmethionine hydrolase